jgi:hypothetical protein
MKLVLIAAKKVMMQMPGIANSAGQNFENFRPLFMLSER